MIEITASCYLKLSLPLKSDTKVIFCTYSAVIWTGIFNYSFFLIYFIASEYIISACYCYEHFSVA